jgi:dihydroflavonol-4-reductase
VGLEADADGKIIVDFLNGRMPGYVETGLNFVGVEECAAGHLWWRKKARLESGICWAERI